jgi:hypothetical protein
VVAVISKCNMLSDSIDLRIFLSDAEFKQRVLRTNAWQDYLTLPPIPDFDEAAALADIEKRNAIRLVSQLPVLDVRSEIARLKETYESGSFGDCFHTLCMTAVTRFMAL